MSSSKNIEAGGAYVRLFTEESDMVRGLRRAEKNFHAWGARIRNIGVGISAATAVAAVPAGLAVAAYRDFGDAIAAVRAVSGATETEFEALANTAKKLGASTSFTAVEVANLMAELGRAGFKPDQMIAMTGAVLDLARATGTDATLASGIMSATIRQFGLEATDATRVADVLTAAANKTFNTVTQLGEAMSYAGPVAADLGMSLEETAAILGTLGNVGIQGSEAGTALRRLGVITAAEGANLKKIFGVTFSDSAGNARPLVEVLGEIGDATKDLGTAERAKKFSEAFGLLGITAASAIGKSAGDARDLLKTLNDVGGTARDTAVMMDDSLGGSLRIFKSAVEGLNIAFGEGLEPTLRSVIDAGTGLVQGLTALTAANPELVTQLALVGAGVGAVGVGLTGLGSTVILVGTGLGALATVAASVPAALIAIPAAAGAIGAVLVTQTGIGIEALAELETTAVSTWQSISDAIAGGDLELAGNVAMAGLNVVWQQGLARLESTYFDTMDRIREKTLTTTIVGEIGSVLTWDHGFKQSMDEEIKGQKIERDQAAQQAVAQAQKDLADLQKKAVDKKAKATAEQKAKADKKTSPKKPGGSVEAPEEVKTAGGGPSSEATTSGLAASLNRGFGEIKTPQSEMTKLGNVTDVTTRKIDEQAAALRRRNDAAVAPPAAVKPPQQPPPEKPQAIPAAKPVVPPVAPPVAVVPPVPEMKPPAQPVAAEPPKPQTPKPEAPKSDAPNTDPRADREKKRQATIAARWDRRFQESGAAEQGWTKEEWIQDQKDQARGKFNVARPEQLAPAGEHGFAPDQKVPHGQGMALPEKGQTQKRGQYLADANAALNDQLGGFGLGERLAALRNVREAKGYPANTPLSTIKKRHPEEVQAELQKNRDKNLLAGTMPSLELGQQAGKESHSRGDVTEFKPGKIASTNRGPLQRKGDAIDAAIAQKQHEADLAKGSAEAFAGMARDPSPLSPQPSALIKAPQQALPVSEEGQAAIADARNWQPPADATPKVPLVPEVSPPTPSPLQPLTESIDQQLADDVQRNLLPTASISVSTGETPPVAPPVVSPATIPVEAQAAPQITATPPAGVTIPVETAPTPPIAVPERPKTRLEQRRDENLPISPDPITARPQDRSAEELRQLPASPLPETQFPQADPARNSELGTRNSPPPLPEMPGLESLDAKFAALSERLANLPMPDFEAQFGNLRMPEIDPPPMPDIEQKIVQSISARDNDKLDAVLDQLKQLNANVRSAGMLT